LSHKYRPVGTASSGGDYALKVDQDDDRFRKNNILISAIAVSTAQSDAGVFELAFHNERLMPFESAGHRLRLAPRAAGRVPPVRLRQHHRRRAAGAVHV
jgi:hypothetical protein